MSDSKLSYSKRRTSTEINYVPASPRQQKQPRSRRATWSGGGTLTKNLFGKIGNDRYFLKIVEVYDECNHQTMQKQLQKGPLVTTNRAVVEDIELNFGDDKDIDVILDQSRAFDAVVFDFLRVLPEDIANQITLIDLPLFQKIPPEELTCCAWTSKKKYEQCPNVVNFTKRFNHVGFWVSREILNSNTAKQRSEKVSHFIKIAKKMSHPIAESEGQWKYDNVKIQKLLDHNNLNSMKAVVSGLQSAPIYRLNKTWNLVPKRDKEKLEKLNELCSEDNNRSKFRTYLHHVKLPCIPYLGMYLTDLTYINTIHPCTGGLDVERTNKMNEILRIIADFQQSVYDFLPIGHIQKYLNSVKYIDELQKFMEDDNYKLSLQIEPSVPMLRTPKQATRNRREVFSESDESNLMKLYPKRPLAKTNSLRGERPSTDKDKKPTYSKSTSLRLPSTSPSPDKKFTPGHRKVKSLGSNQQFLASLGALNTVGLSTSQQSTNSNASNGSKYNLMDDSPICDEVDGDLHVSTSYDSGLDHDEPETHPIIQSFEAPVGEELTPHLPEVYFKLQGFLKRKTYLKNGNKPKVTSWQRYWVGITGSCLVYFLPKYRGFGGHERNNFRTDPHKVLPLGGCSAFPVGEPDCFQLTDEYGDNVYRFRSGTQSNANLWCKYIREAADGQQNHTPTNLITFDDSDDDTRL